jgi:hypothetical protein
MDDLCTHSRDGKSIGKTSLSYIEDKAIEIVTGKSYSASSKQMDWGHEYEPEAREWYAITHLVEVEEIFFIAVEDFAGVSPDGKAGDIHLEIKCPYSAREHWRNMKMSNAADLRKRHRQYYHQIQFTLWAMDLELSHFFSYRPDFPAELKGFTLEVPRNEEAIKMILDKLFQAEELLQVELKDKIDNVKERRAEIQRPGYPYVHSRLVRSEGGGWSRSNLAVEETGQITGSGEIETWENPFSLYGGGFGNSISFP